ncbi:MAG: YcaO-like family protein [Solirubrobacteraceae bacterium]
MTGLVSTRGGIVRDVCRVALPPHLPAELRLYAAALTDCSRTFGWPADRSGAGCAWWDEEAARCAALGEAVERYCGNLVPMGLMVASYEQLVAHGEPAIDPSTLALFSAEQHASDGFPYEPFTGELRVHWTEGRDLVTGRPCRMPASLVYPSYASCTEHGAPRTNPVPYAGLAAARSRSAALLAAMLELLERDAVTLAWLAGGPLVQIAVPEPFDALFAGPERALRTSLVLFPSAYGVPVLGALVHDPERKRFALGTACRPDPWQAALKAVCEAMQLHPILDQLDDPRSALMRDAAAPGGCLHPWRADRAYRCSYAPDLRDATDLLCQLQLHLDPSLHGALLARVHDGPTLGLEAVAPGGPTTAAQLAARLTDAGLRVAWTDVTTSDVRPLGWHAVRVVVPGLQPNTPPAFPALGGARLRAALRRLGAAPDLSPIPYA